MFRNVQKFSGERYIWCSCSCTIFSYSVQCTGYNTVLYTVTTVPTVQCPYSWGRRGVPHTGGYPSLSETTSPLLPTHITDKDKCCKENYIWPNIIRSDIFSIWIFKLDLLKCDVIWEINPMQCFMRVRLYVFACVCFFIIWCDVMWPSLIKTNVSRGEKE